MKKTLFLIILFFLISCQNEYSQFHQEKEIEQNNQTELNSFSLEKIKYLSGLILKETPNLDLLHELTQKIDNAENKVYIEVYIFTEKRLKKSIINAKKRGLDVKVILEKNIYLAGNLNYKTFNDLKNNDIEVVYSNSENYSLNHTKMMIIDDEVIISTGNYSYSTFKYNREFFLFLKDKEFLNLFLDIFLSDFNGIKKSFSNPNLILSPFSSRKKLQTLIKSAKKSIKIYSHNFSDESITNLILDKKKEDLDIKIIFPDLKKVSSNKNQINLFKENNINLKLIDKPEIHAKAILIDEKYLYIGSINFSDFSIDKNREIGLLITNKEIIDEFLECFENDFFNS